MPASLSLISPTLRAIISRVREDIAGDMGEDDARIKGTFARAAGNALAGAVKGIYGFATAVANELHPATMVDFGIPLWGASLGLTRIPARQSLLFATLTFTGTGGTLAAGEVLTSATGVEFIASADTTRATPGTETIEVYASSAGASGSLEVGASLTLSIPHTGMNNTLTVSAVTATGADEETLAAWKVRILERLASPPQGGSATDYVAWAKAASSNITAAWCMSNTPWLGNVTVYFTVAPTAGDPASHIPTGGDISTVQAAIALKQPAHSVGLVTAAAPSAYDLNLNLALLPDTAATQAAVLTAIDAYCQSGGITPGGIIDPEEIRAMIRSELHALDTSYTFTLIDIDGDAPPPVITLMTGTLPVRNTTTFSAWPF